ncbi:MAG: hypothetical protein ACI85K_000365 [Hyphomicrobiaceae bacterium]|jgi:hypothetical protein
MWSAGSSSVVTSYGPRGLLGAAWCQCSCVTISGYWSPGLLDSTNISLFDKKYGSAIIFPAGVPMITSLVCLSMS